MDDFCGSIFWDPDVTWNTDNPDFTPCFEKTALVWVPCGFLCFCSLFDIYFSYANKSKHIPRSPLNVAKMIFTSILIILELIYLKEGIFPSDEAMVYPVDIVSPVIKITTYIYYLALLSYSLKKGVQSSAVQFLFWLLMAICKAVILRTVIMNRLQKPELLPYILEIIYFPTVLAMLFLHSWADAMPKFPMDASKSEKPCPETSSSYLSRQMFSWYTSMVWLGYRKPLELTDLWDLNPRDKSRNVVPIFDKNWAYELNKTNTKRAKKMEGRAAYGKISNGASNGVTNSVQFQAEEKKKGEEPEYTSSILPPLFYSFGGRFIFGCMLKLVPDLLVFVSPQEVKSKSYLKWS